MKHVYSLVLIVLCSLILFAGGEGFRITIVPGEHYRHTLPLFLFVKLHNPPQMVLWAESTDGEFIATLMVTEKGATQTWRKAPGDIAPAGGLKRPSALPVWSGRSGCAGVEKVDAVTQATPKGGFSVEGVSIPGGSPFYLYFEVNHSTDFNAAYPADVQPGDADYSGGAWGNGQPALVYRLLVDPSRIQSKESSFELIGHSSPSGADGAVYEDLTGIDTALGIVSEVRLQSRK